MKKHYKKIIAGVVVGAGIVVASLSGGRVGPKGIYPDVAGVVNPDMTQANISQNLCNPNWSTKSIRPPVSYTNPIKVTALARYNQENSTNYQMADGELDHLISIENGGSPTDPNNLWFESYTTTINGKRMGAHEKDSLENEIHKEICAGTITLTEGQQELTGDWYKYYLQMNKTPQFGSINSSLDQDDQ